MEGILPVDKPAGMTSYDVIRVVKKLLPRRHKIGHAGTLDPFASGVLVLLLGKATKRFDEIQKWEKTYRAVAVLGAYSDTLDREGEIERRISNMEHRVDKQQIQLIADKYVGEREQVVPAYAAAKYKGRKLYEYAREGKEVPQKKKTINIYNIEVLRVESGEVEMRVVCGSGTYIRQLSYDILREMGVESYLDTLVRESVGKITLGDCTNLEKLTDEGMVVQRLWPEYDG
jgi:tRNA pseudouridine55 synthase